MATATLVTTGITVLDDADAATQWSADRALAGPDTELYYETSGSMGCTILAATNADEIWITKSTGVWDLSDTHIRLWLFFTPLGVLDTYGNGGIQIGVGDGSNTGWWNVSGSGMYTGGWKLLQIDTRLAVDAGTKPTDMTQITDVRLKVVLTSSPKNAQNLWTDFWHETDAGFEVYGGTSSDPVTWADVAAADRAAGYGIVQEIDGVYFVTGPVQIGSGTQNTYFSWTTETVIFVDNEVDSGFYGLTAYGANTEIDISGGTIAALADRFELNFGDATIVGSQVSIDGLVAQLAGAVTFKAGQSVTGCKFVDCGQITVSTATFENNSIRDYSGTDGALLWPTSGNVADCQFQNCDRAIEMTQVVDQTFDNIQFSGK
jgi:hypothetical protein